MNEPDLDQLRQRWQTAHAAVEPTLELDIEALRTALVQSSRRAFSRHAFWLSAQWPIQLGVLVALGMFLVSHWHDPLYRAFALAPALLALAQVGVSATRWWALRRLDFAAPVCEVRDAIERLRARQLRVTRWILLSSVLLWLPLLLVIVRGVTGIDLLDVLHPSVLAINLLVGVVFLVLGDVVLRMVARRFAGASWLRALHVESAGRSWQRAEQSFEVRAELEQALTDQDGSTVIADYHSRAAMPALLSAPLRVLEQRLLLASIFYGLLLLLVAAFNASHAGQPQFLVAGVLLNLFVVAQMASAIQHRVHLAALLEAPIANVDARISHAARQHLGIVRRSIWFVPAMLLPAAQVLGKALLGIDAFAALPTMIGVVLLATALLGILALARNAAQSTLLRAASLLMFGVPGLSEAVRRRVRAQ